MILFSIPSVLSGYLSAKERSELIAVLGIRTDTDKCNGIITLSFSNDICGTFQEN